MDAKRIQELLKGWKKKSLDVEFHDALKEKLQLVSSSITIDEVQADSYILEENFSSVYSKFLKGQSYGIDDMKLCAGHVFRSSSDGALSTLLVTVSYASLKEFLSKNHDSTFFVVLQEAPKLWVTFAVLKTDLPQTDPRKIKQQIKEQHWTILYKNPSGSEMSTNLKTFLESLNQKTDIYFNAQNGLKGCGVNDLELVLDFTGPLTIRSLAIIKTLVDEKKTSLTDLKNASFPDMTRLKPLAMQKIRFHAQRLYRNKRFQEKLEEFRKSVPTDFSSNVSKFYENIKENRDYHEIRKTCFKKEVLEAVDKSMKHNFSNEIHSFRTVSKLISYSTQAKTLDSYYSGIKIAFNKLLNIDMHLMQVVFMGNCEAKFIPHLLPGGSCLSELMAFEQTNDFDDFKKSLPYTVNTRLEHVKFHYQELAKQNYSTIQGWAHSIRGKFAINNSANPENKYLKSLAYLERGFVLSTGIDHWHGMIGYYLLMTFEHGTGTRMVKVEDARFRTYLIAVVAIVKVLMGHKVDIIMSSQAQTRETLALTKKLYNFFGISVDHNENRNCYLNDVVYGSMERFQFDFLKDEAEGMPILSGRLTNYVPCCLLISEAEPMSISANQNFAKISENFPGTDRLRYIYIHIWEILRRAEVDYADDVRRKLKNKLLEITTRVKSRGLTDDEAQVEYEKFLEEVTSSQMEVFEGEILKTFPHEVSTLPRFLETYVECKIKKWTQSAVLAKYYCVENRHYRILEGRIVPVDQKTGIMMEKGSWKDGLQQFLQLKHGLRISGENVKSVFISNLGYIDKYNKNETFCFASNFGSRREHRFFQRIHQSYLKFVSPDNRDRSIERAEQPGMVLEDSSWRSMVVEEAVEYLSKKRAVVIVCGCVEEAQCLAESFQFLNNMKVQCNIRRYFEESHMREFGVVDSGDLIVTTRIVGVGVGFQLSQNLTTNNRIYVIVAFLPSTAREETRLFSFGEGKIIIRNRDVSHFGLNSPSLDEIRLKRQQTEDALFNSLEDKTLLEIRFQDDLANKFISYYKTQRLLADSDPGNFLVLRDLKECWALWLEQQDFDEEQIENADSAFKKFRGEMQLDDTNVNMDGYNLTNPYYTILRAQHEIEAKEFLDASIRLNKLLATRNEIDHLAGAHLKLLQINLEKRNYMLNGFKEAINDKIAEEKEFAESLKDAQYKNEKVLENASNALNLEIESLDKNVLNQFSIKSNVEHVVVACRTDFCPFLHQMKAKLSALTAFKIMVEYLLQDVKNYASDKIIVRFMVPQFLTENATTGNNVLRGDMNEFFDEGFDGVYTLNLVKMIPPEIAENTKTLIKIARGLCDMAIFFPNQALAGIVCAVDGICASTLSLLTEFNTHPEAALVCWKILSPIPTDQVYGDEFLTTDLLKKAIKAGQRTASYSLSLTPVGIEISNRLSGISNNLAEAHKKTLEANRDPFNASLEKIDFQIVTKSLKVIPQPILKILFAHFIPWMLDHVSEYMSAALIKEKKIKYALRYHKESEETVLKKISDYAANSFDLIDMSIAMANKFKKLFTNWLTLTGICDIYSRSDAIDEELVKFTSGLKEFIVKEIEYVRHSKPKDWDHVCGEVVHIMTNAVSKMTFRLLFSTFFFSEKPRDLYEFLSLNGEGGDAKKSPFEAHYTRAALDLYFIDKMGKAGVAKDQADLRRAWENLKQKN